VQKFFVTLPLTNLDAVTPLPHTPASEVKKPGWRGVMRLVRRNGKMVITNHNEPEAIVLSAKACTGLTQLAQQSATNTESALVSLQQGFDARLATARATDCGPSCAIPSGWKARSRQAQVTGATMSRPVLSERD
jgi:hypothetical protein